MTSAWSQLEQLLTCCVCLDRFRNPKLLPCQHTFCGEPCLEGLVDYARRQIKCPECRAEHRIPYNGVQSFPNNVTLARFLDLHRGITGEEPEPLPSQMDRCGVCSEKAFCEKCAHCDKKVCEECKEAHLDILRREINRINGQVRRGLGKLTEHSLNTGRNSEKLQLNCRSIKEDITESVRRIIKDLKDKESKLLHELEEYTQTEAKNVEKLKEDLEQEVNNITSNCELAENHINENEEWTDAELVEYKEIFVKTSEFLRNLDPDTSDFARKIKFQYKTDFDVLRRSVADFGELKITTPNVLLSPSESSSNLNSLSVPNQTNLLRSQSDHRLASQFQQRKQGDSRFLDISSSQTRLSALTHSDTERDNRLERNTSPTRQRFGRYDFDRRDIEEPRSRYNSSSTSALTRNWPRPTDLDDTTTPTTHFRSRFMRERNNQELSSFEDSHDSDYGSSHRSVRFEEPATQPRVKVFETEEVTRGPMSGVIKLVDSPHVMERLHQNEVRQKLKEQEAQNAPPPVTQPPPVTTPVTQTPRRAPSRQVSEDEIEKQKKANQVAAAAATPTPPAPAPVAPQSPKTPVPQSPVQTSAPESQNRIINRRVTQLQKEDSVTRYSSDSSRRGSDVEDNPEDSDNSGVGRFSRRRNGEESDSSRVTVVSRQNSSSGQRQVSIGSDIEGDKNSPSADISPPIASTDTSAAVTTTAIYSAPITSPITTTTSLPSTPISAITTPPISSDNIVGKQDSKDSKESQDSPACPQPTPTIKYKIVSKPISSTASSPLTSNNSVTETQPENRTQSSDMFSSRLSAKTPNFTRLSSDVRFDKTTNSSGNSDYTGYTPVYSSRRSPALTDNLMPIIPKASTNHLSIIPANTSLSSRSSVNSSTDSGSPESGVRRVSLEDFRGQERPNYNPYRQARANPSTVITSTHMPITRDFSHYRSPSTVSSIISSVPSEPQQTSYRQTLSSLGYPDSSNERQIITNSIDWGITLFDYLCYSIGFIIFITVLLYRSVRSPLGKNPSIDRSADRHHNHNQDINDNTTNRHTIGSDKQNVRTLSTDIDSETSDTNASNDSSAESETDSEVEDESTSLPVKSSNTVSTSAGSAGSAGSGRVTSSSHERQQERSERTIQLPASVSNLLTRSAQARQDNLNAITKIESPNYSRYSRQTTLTDETNNTPPYRGRRTSDTSKDDSNPTTTTPSYQPRRNLSRAATLEDDDDQSSTAYSRFLARSRTSSTLANKDESNADDSRFTYTRRPDKYGTTASSTYRSRLAKSKSSHTIAGFDDSDEETTNASPLSPTYKSKYGESVLPARRTSRSSGYTYRTRDPGSPPPDDETGQSVAQYLMNKYGTKSSSQKSEPTNRATSILKSKSSHVLFGRSISSSDEEPSTASLSARRSSRDEGTSLMSSLKGSAFGLTYPRQMYLQKGRPMMKIGSRGTEPGCFTWPRGVTVGQNNSIVVADSSNHRVQVFDSTGRFSFEFGSYGSNEGEFDCLAGVCVNRIGQFIVSDRYNHRIQLFDPSGRFLRAFGSEGRSDGRFSYPWGITTDALGFIYICDKENHRIQVFQSDGMFVGKFGTIGSRTGMLEHPHYVAVSNTNRVVISDSNNHRIQIFDVNGRTLSTFGSEGSNDGQFKFPRGVAVDDQGFIIVGDSGNNRVQVFNPDGTFLKSFGTWGSGEGEFKGLEGVAITSTGNILVCDRENHRIQMF